MKRLGGMMVGSCWCGEGVVLFSGIPHCASTPPLDEGEGVMMVSSLEEPVRRSGAGILQPLTPQASTGNTTVFRTWMLSFGHNLLALRNTAAGQLYLIMTPASVSSGVT